MGSQTHKISPSIPDTTTTTSLPHYLHWKTCSFSIPQDPEKKEVSPQTNPLHHMWVSTTEIRICQFQDTTKFRKYQVTGHGYLSGSLQFSLLLCLLGLEVGHCLLQSVFCLLCWLQHLIQTNLETESLTLSLSLSLPLEVTHTYIVGESLLSLSPSPPPSESHILLL